MTEIYSAPFKVEINFSLHSGKPALKGKNTSHKICRMFVKMKYNKEKLFRREIQMGRK